MGDVWKAYELLNSAVKLGRKGVVEATAAEMAMKRAFAEREGYPLTPDFDERWEFKVQLVPRRRPLSAAAKRALNEARETAGKGRRKSA